MAKPAQQLDLSGVNAPIPLLRAQQLMQAAQPGTVLELMTTDPAAPELLSIFAQQSAHSVASSTERNGRFHIILQKQ